MVTKDKYTPMQPTPPAQEEEKNTRMRRRDPHGCPVLVEARRTARLGRVMLRSLRRLRRSLHLCERCALSGDGLCPALESLQSQIHTAIEAVMEEWGSY